MKFEDYKTNIWETPQRMDIISRVSPNPLLKDEVKIHENDIRCLQKIDWFFYCGETDCLDEISEPIVFETLEELFNYLKLCIVLDFPLGTSFDTAASLTLNLFEFCKTNLLYDIAKLEELDNKLFYPLHSEILDAINTKTFNFETMLQKVFSWGRFRRKLYRITEIGFMPLEVYIPTNFYNKYTEEFFEYRNKHFEEILTFAKYSIFIYLNARNVKNESYEKYRSFAEERCMDALASARQNGRGRTQEESLNNVIELIALDDSATILAFFDETPDWKDTINKRLQQKALKESLLVFLETNKQLLDTKYAKLNTGIADKERVINKIIFVLNLMSCKILLLTANECEDKVITRMLYEENGEKAIEMQVIRGYRIHIGKIGKYKVAHVHQKHSGSSSDDGSEAAVLFMSKYFKPKLVLSIGVAYGIDYEDQAIGDVLFSERIIDVDKWNKRLNGEYKLGIENIYKSNIQILSSWEHLLNERHHMKSFDWHLGAILSKGTVLSDSVEKMALIDSAKPICDKPIIGGEMEGSGIVRACKNTNLSRWLVVKGICDWGERKNDLGEIALELGFSESNEVLKDSMQAYAAENAFLAVRELLTKVSCALN